MRCRKATTHNTPCKGKYGHLADATHPVSRQSYLHGHVANGTGPLPDGAEFLPHATQFPRTQYTGSPVSEKTSSRKVSE